MPELKRNKLIYGGETLIDLTDASIRSSEDAGKILKDETAYGADGSKVVGTCEYDVKSAGVTAADSEVLNGKTFAKDGSIHTGSMANNGQQVVEISDLNNKAIAGGYSDNSSYAKVADTEKAKFLPENIKEGITLMGVTGTHSGSEDVKATSPELTPYTTEAEYQPSDFGDYNYFASVKVKPIAYEEVENAAGGLTVTIGTVAPAV